MREWSHISGCVMCYTTGMGVPIQGNTFHAKMNMTLNRQRQTDRTPRVKSHFERNRTNRSDFHLST